MNSETNERLLAYVDTILGCVDREELLTKTIDFLMHECRLSNCSIHMFENVARFYNNSKSTLDNIEGSVWKQLNDAKLPANCNVHSEFKAFDSIKNIAPQLCAIPWVLNKKLEGMCCLYSEQPIDVNLSLAKGVMDKLGKALISAIKYNQAQVSAVTDRLTGLYNKGFFNEALDRELQRAKLDKTATSLLIMDIDNFKNYNDTNGHPEGDKVLAKVADCIRHNIRPHDIACRYGGEEFVVILPNCRSEPAYNRAEELRKTIQDKCPLTISIGVMSCLNSSINAETMLKEADTALYKAKRAGKNKTVNFVVIDKALGVIDVQDASAIGAR